MRSIGRMGMMAVAVVALIGAAGCDLGGSGDKKSAAADQFTGMDNHVYALSSVKAEHYAWTMLDASPRVCPVCHRLSMVYSEAIPKAEKFGAALYLWHCYEPDCLRSFYDLTEPGAIPLTNASASAVQARRGRRRNRDTRARPDGQRCASRHNWNMGPMGNGSCRDCPEVLQPYRTPADPMAETRHIIVEGPA